MTPLTALDLRVAPRRRRREAIVRLLFAAAAGMTIVISAAIVLSLIGTRSSFLFKVDRARSGRDGWFPRRDLYGIPTIVAGTLVIAGIAHARRGAARPRRGDLPLRVRRRRHAAHS